MTSIKNSNKKEQMSDQQYSPTGFTLLPPVVKNLLIINGLFFLATISLSKYGIDLEKICGLYYIKSPLFQPYQFVTYMFIHANFGHIFFNLFALWMFGYLLENYWGSKRFLIFYMFCGIGAAFTQTFVHWLDYSSIQSAAEIYMKNPSPAAFNGFVSAHFPNYSEQVIGFIAGWQQHPESQNLVQQSFKYIADLQGIYLSVPTVGASGAIYGILLAFGMTFPNMLIYLYFLVPIKAKWAVLGFGALELFSGLRNNPTDNVAHFAHLGGMVFGLLLILYWKKRPFSR
ncbi:MAG: rhomboid family intramembrane serine protease [Bacteroidetes bacterium]|nr:rhomboid family intramembrane serine protease [Bacteroidota bacterium]